MMKLFLRILSFTTVVFSCTQNIEIKETSGSIVGIVADKTTGAPVPVVNLLLEPGGKSTVTGSDGAYFYKDLDPGVYTIHVSKEGYKDNSGKVTVAAGLQTEGDLLIERIPAKMTVDKTELDFGADQALNSLSFSIVNRDYATLLWSIGGLEDWVKVDPMAGELSSGKTSTVIVTIDRNHEKVKPGDNSSVLVIRSGSGHGSAEVMVKLIGEAKEEPAVNVLAATNITSSTATLNGRITNPGIPSYVERGFYYSGAKIDANNVDNNPAVFKVTCPVNEAINYEYTLSELQTDKEYYARAYVINRDTRVISTNEISFKPSPTIPSVSIQEASGLDVSRRSIILNGTVTYEGDPVYSEKGFVYGTNSSPTTYDTQISVEGTTPGIFTVPVTGLQLDKTYYARAYIRQRDLTYYSNETVSFCLRTTSPESQILQVSEKSYSAGQAKISGRINSAGIPAYSRRGFVYGYTSNPKVETDKWQNVTGTGTGNFSLYLTNLVTDRQYFVRVFVEQNEKIYYGTNELSFTLSPVPTSLGAIAVSEVDNYSAKVTSSFLEVGDPAYSEKGFVYNTSGNPEVDRHIGKVVVDGTGAGVFSARFSNLNPNTIYYAKAYAIQNGQVNYSAEQSFKTGKQNPVVNTNSASDVAFTTATLNATIISVGDPPYNRRGFYYGTDSNLTASSSTVLVENANAQGDYSMKISGLEEKTTYYYRAYVLQEGESTPTFGAINSFTTGHKPNVTTGGLINISCSGTNESTLNWSGTLYGGLSDEGDPSYTSFGFVYGAVDIPTVGDGVSSYMTTATFDQSGSTRIFYATVSGLKTGVQYHFRAVASTPLGYAYGDPYEFTPAVIPPNIRTYKVDCQKNANNEWVAGLYGLCGYVGQPAATGFGFVYSLSNNPTVGSSSSTSITYSAIEKYNDNGYFFGAPVLGLAENKTYYFRAYVKTQLGYTYGEIMSFRTN